MLIPTIRGREREREGILICACAEQSIRWFADKVWWHVAREKLYRTSCVSVHLYIYKYIYSSFMPSFGSLKNTSSRTINLAQQTLSLFLAYCIWLLLGQVWSSLVPPPLSSFSSYDVPTRIYTYVLFEHTRLTIENFLYSFSCFCSDIRLFHLDFCVILICCLHTFAFSPATCSLYELYIEVNNSK